MPTRPKNGGPSSRSQDAVIDKGLHRCFMHEIGESLRIRASSSPSNDQAAEWQIPLDWLRDDVDPILRVLQNQRTNWAKHGQGEEA